MRLACVVDGHEGVAIETHPPAGRVVDADLRAFFEEPLVDFHQERCLAVARVAGQQHKALLAPDDRGQQLVSSRVGT